MDIPNIFIQPYLENTDKRNILILCGAAAEILLRLAPKVYEEFIKKIKIKNIIFRMYKYNLRHHQDRIVILQQV